MGFPRVRKLGKLIASPCREPRQFIWMCTIRSHPCCWGDKPPKMIATRCPPEHIGLIGDSVIRHPPRICGLRLRLANPPCEATRRANQSVHRFCRPAPFEKIFWFSEVANHFISTAVPSQTEGRLAIVTNAGRDAVDALALLTNSAGCGRQNRVVLTPRRRRQVCGKRFPQATVTRKPDRRGEYDISRKPLRGECRVIPVYLTNACALYHTHCTRGYRAHRTPGIPCALVMEEGGTCRPNLAQTCGEIAEVCLKPAWLFEMSNCSPSRLSSSAKADDPVRRGLSALSLMPVEYWIARWSLSSGSPRRDPVAGDDVRQ
jgi:hypothetical protein